MRFKLLACEIFRHEISAVMAQSPHQIDVEFLPMQLHTAGRKRMKSRLIEFLAAVNEEGYDALLLAYGLCSGGTAGLSAGTIPMVIPRAHDCITLFLGSRQRYQDYFFANGGTYFLTSGWCETENAFDYDPEMMPFYNKVAFIEMGVGAEESLAQQARGLAEERNWEFELIPGDLSLFRRFLNGDWNEDFLIVPPGRQIRESYDDYVIEVTP
ncbi:MAG: DUF1638 domain-containing protein [Planctomycetaceae bacterium]|jgi:hypothetical protein|nr:DUF1638 domain-containing protein [Planctomycetaceae bacterium]